ncbi:MAG: hypothetical protein LH614_21205, partial [Pyrinomonadaceae bacterium]|nr:hypothetical protein [Pyrinomonadaceae bacterium]
MKHAVISEKPPTKPRSLAGKAVLKSILQSVQIVAKQSKSSPKNNEAKAVKEVSAKQFVPVIAPTIEKTVSAKLLQKTKIKIVETPKLKAKSAKTAKVTTAQVSAKKSQTTASKRPLKAEAAKIKVFADAKAAVTREIKIAAVAKS